jgi:hypothetical protein
MSIPVTCPECQSHFHVGDEFAGRPGRCPDCTAILQVPDPAAPVEHAEIHEDPHPYWTPRGPEAFEPAPAPVRESRRDERSEPAPRRRPDDRPREKRFDPRERAERWARVHRGLGYVQVAVLLGFVSQILQTVLMLARGGVQQDPNALPDSGQIALGFGMAFMILAAWMFWVLGRAAGLRVPYVPARSCARASFVMVLGSIGAFLVTFCLLFAALGAAAQAGANGGPPPPGAVLLMLMMLGSMCLSAGLAGGAEIAGLMALGRIGDALRDRAAAGWARRSIVVMVLAGTLMVFGFCGVFVYLGAKEEQRQQQAQAAGAANPAPAPANDKDKPKQKRGDKEAPKEKDKADNAKEAAPAQPPAAGPAQNPPPEPIDQTMTLVLDLVFFGPLILYLIHYSVALQAGRRAIRREIDVLTGKDHGEHDHQY